MKLHHAITDLMDKTYRLLEADYQDDLSSYLKEIEETIQTREWQSLDGIEESYWESRCYGMDYALDELAKEIASEFDVDIERAKEFVEKYNDYIEDEINNRDTSNIVADLMRHTSAQIFYYLLDGEINSSIYSKEDYKDAVKEIKRTLGIKMRDTTWNEQIDELIVNASYGGNIEVFFSDDIEDYIPNEKNQNVKYITFKNPEIGVIDRFNGSGHNVTFDGLELKVKMNWENLRLDKNHGYSYTYDICGMISTWCDSTQVKLISK